MKKRILFMIPSLYVGGMEKVLINYANLLSKRGHYVHILNYSDHDEIMLDHLSKEVKYTEKYRPVPNIIHAKVSDIFRLNFRLLNFSNWMKRHSPKYLYKKFITWDYDIEVAFFGSDLIKVLCGSTNQHSIKIGWIHSQNRNEHLCFFKNHKEAEFIYNKIDNLVCVSEDVKTVIKNEFKRTKNVYILYNPNDTEDIIKLGSDKNDLIFKKRFTLINASRISIHQKGFDRLLDAVSMLNIDRLEFDLWIVGDGNDMNELAELIEHKKIYNIMLLGQQKNPYKYIKAADLYICSSRVEGFSMVMAETLILGKPIISTDVSGAREMLGDSEYGLVVENSTIGIYTGLKLMIEDKALYEHYCKKAELRRNFLNEEKIIDKFEALFC